MSDEIDYQEELQREWINFASNSFIGEKFSPGSQNQSSVNVDKKRIKDLLKNPTQNFEILQQYSRLEMTKEGIYYRFIKTLANMLTFDHVLIPLVDQKNIKKSNIQRSFFEASLYTQKMKIKQNAVKFMERCLRDGECYVYKIENDTGIVYQRIENKYCLPYQNIDGVYRYVVDMSKFASVKDISVYPLEFQKAIELYKNDSKSPVFIQSRYYPVSDNGFCFITTDEAIHSIPPFAFLFSELISLSDKKDLKDNVDLINNTKMIHNQIDISDKDSPIDPKVASVYNNAIKQNLIKKNLDKGIFTITNPFKAQVLNLNTANDTTNRIVKDSISQVYSECGISEMFFNSEKGGAEALKKSTINSMSLCVNLFIPFVQDYINYELSKLETPIPMMCKIYNTTHYNIDDKLKESKDSLAYGGSKMEFLAFKGYTPLEGMNLLKQEKVLDIDSLFNPIQTSHTMSSKDNNKTKPNADEMEKEGKEVSESTQKLNNSGNV